MACVSYCDSSLLDHNLVNCNEYKLGGVSAILVGACGTELVDPSDEVEVQALIDAGTAKLIEDIRFAVLRFVSTRTVLQRFTMQT
jgi:hypothetical protein